MRLLLELIVAGLIILLAWEIPFRERVADIPGIGDTLSGGTSHARKRKAPAPAPTVSGAWMWDPNRKSALDRPSPTPSSHEH